MPAAIAGTPIQGGTTPGTLSYTVPLPSGVTAGELLVVHAARYLDTLTTADAGWVKQYQISGPSNLGRHSVFMKVADGTETVLNLTGDGSYNDKLESHVTFRVSGQHASDYYKAATSATGTTANPNPPNNDTGSTEEYLWIASFGAAGSRVYTASPTDYTFIGAAGGGTGTNGSLIAASYRVLSAQAEDPGTFTVNASIQWCAVTYAIRPAAGAAGIDGDLVPVERQRSIRPVTGTLDLPGDLGIVRRHRRVVPMTASFGAVAGDLSPVSRDRSVRPMAGTMALSATLGTIRRLREVRALAGGFGVLSADLIPVLRQRQVLALDGGFGAVQGSVEPVRRLRWVLAMLADAPETTEGDLVPVSRLRRVLPLVASFGAVAGTLVPVERAREVRSLGGTLGTLSGDMAPISRTRQVASIDGTLGAVSGNIEPVRRLRYVLALTQGFATVGQLVPILRLRRVLPLTATFLRKWPVVRTVGVVDQRGDVTIVRDLHTVEIPED